MIHDRFSHVTDKHARYRLRHREQRIAAERDYRERNKDERNKAQRERRRMQTIDEKEHPARYMREYNKTPSGKRAIQGAKLKEKFGITLAEYEAMLLAQNGRCAICDGPPSGRWQSLHVDHSHATGKVRALLCHHCNVALGLAEDDPRLLRAMADYLDRYSEG